MARLVYVQKLLTMFQGVTILRPLVAYSFIVGNKRQKLYFKLHRLKQQSMFKLK